MYGNDDAKGALVMVEGGEVGQVLGTIGIRTRTDLFLGQRW